MDCRCADGTICECCYPDKFGVSTIWGRPMSVSRSGQVVIGMPTRPEELALLYEGG
jgi:hypothetical protein